MDKNIKDKSSDVNITAFNEDKNFIFHHSDN